MVLKHLVNGLIAFPIKGNSFFSNFSESLPKNSPDCPILYNWGFANFILADEPFAKASQSLKASALVNKNLRGKYFHH